MKNLFFMIQLSDFSSVIDVLISSSPILLGWLLYVLLVFLTKWKQQYKLMRLPTFLILVSISIVWLADIFELRSISALGVFLLGISTAYLLARIFVHFGFYFFYERKRGTSSPGLMKTIVFFTLLVLILLIFNEYLLTEEEKFDPTSILASAAVVSVVLGFALQDTLGSLFSGLALHLESPIKVGNWVKIGDTIGKVVELDWRSVKLRTMSHDYHIIPNSTVASNLIVNYSDPPQPHRREIRARAPYSAYPEKVQASILEILNNNPGVEKNPAPTILFRDFQDHWIDYEIRYWYTDYSILEILDGEIRKHIWYHFRRDRIESPVPEGRILMQTVSELPRDYEGQRADLKHWLHDIAIFNPLNQNEMESIILGMKRVDYAAGETIIIRGKKGKRFFVIYDGEAEVSISEEGGQQSVVKLLQRGDYFGEIALLTGEVRTATITALTATTCYVLDKEIFSKVLNNNPKIIETLSEILFARQAELEESMSILEKKSAAGSDTRRQQTMLSKIKEYFGID